MTLAIEVNSIAVAIAARIELLPVIALHIHIGTKHEIDHLILNKDIVHVVELLRAKDDVWIILCAVASLIGIHHVSACILQNSDKRLHIPVFEVALGEDLLTLCQSICSLLSAETASLGNGKVLL